MNIVEIQSFSEIAVIQSQKAPDDLIGAENGTELCIQSDPLQVVLIIPGLNGENGTVSFQSLEDPSKYLSVDNGQLNLTDRNATDDLASFDNASTFYIRENRFLPDFVGLESYISPEHFVRRQDTELKVQEDDESDSFAKDASFKILYPARVQGKRS